ncbi:hypothetical protein CFC21_033917 [Triticum aestivum]|uniref:Cathepsin propeptide inhibitor domain-containing protein n=2 Tax=Triticum aestivum TaxID=4565 RepID=A0A9R1F212_WHEAT|nr:hypothetical protein CFC21_033917 [Triticum aestivum]
MTGHTITFSMCRCSSVALCVLLATSCLMLAGCSSESLPTSDDLPRDRERSDIGTDDHHGLMMGRFHVWMTAQNRSYSTSDEKARRFEVYKSNMRYIEAVNAEATTSGLTYELGEGPFTDLTDEEFMALYTRQILEDDEQIITTHVGPVNGAGTYEGVACMPTSQPGRRVAWTGGREAPSPRLTTKGNADLAGHSPPWVQSKDYTSSGEGPWCLCRSNS